MNPNLIMVGMPRCGVPAGAFPVWASGISEPPAKSGEARAETAPAVHPYQSVPFVSAFSFQNFSFHFFLPGVALAQHPIGQSGYDFRKSGRQNGTGFKGNGLGLHRRHNWRHRSTPHPSAKTVEPRMHTDGHGYKFGRDIALRCPRWRFPVFGQRNF